MSTSRYFITGGSGQLARELSKRLPGSVARSREELSITDLRLLRRELASSNADVVFNCAAYNSVDRAEQDPATAAAVNAEGAANVARACREVGARLIHFSTNYVFDGRADWPYTEVDEPHPLSAYGRSKLEGELRVLDTLPSALVIRSSGLFGHGGSASKGGSLPDRLLARAREGGRLSLVEDQRLNPTFTGHLADASLTAAASNAAGLLHLVAGGCCSYHEFAIELLLVAGVDAEVDAVATTKSGATAERPLNGCLLSIRTEPLPTWQAGLRAYWQTRSVNVG